MDALLEIFSTKGRANRAWYFWHVLLDDLVVFTLFVALVMIGVLLGPLVVLPLIGVMIAGVWAAIAITVKRLHDLGRPGWHWFGFMVPIYNIYLSLVVLLQKGTEGSNRYGPDPLTTGEASGYIEG